MLKGKTAVITGAGSGIGFEIAKTYAENEANVCAIVHNKSAEVEKEFMHLADDYGVKTWIYEMEMLEIESVKKTIRDIYKELDAIDILINNAAKSIEKTLLQTTYDVLSDVMKVNFFMPSYITQTLSRKMVKQQSGIIINIISRAALEYRAGVYAYGASKAALLWGTKAMAKEFAYYNIRVNGIAPGLTETKMGTGNRDDEAIRIYVQDNNIKRPAKTYEIADVALFLASDSSSYISGQIISVDGGRD